MWAAVTYKVLNGKFYHVALHQAETRQAAAMFGEKYAAGQRRLAPTKHYCVLVGELTSELEQPKLPPTSLKPLSAKEPPMWAAVVYQNTNQSGAVWTFMSGHSASTRDAAAQFGEKAASSYRNTYPQYTYKVLVGELTEEVVPPEAQIEFRPAKPSL